MRWLSEGKTGILVFSVIAVSFLVIHIWRHSRKEKAARLEQEEKRRQEAAAREQVPSSGETAALPAPEDALKASPAAGRKQDPRSPGI